MQTRELHYIYERRHTIQVLHQSAGEQKPIAWISTYVLLRLNLGSRSRWIFDWTTNEKILWRVLKRRDSLGTESNFLRTTPSETLPRRERKRKGSRELESKNTGCETKLLPGREDFRICVISRKKWTAWRWRGYSMKRLRVLCTLSAHFPPLWSSPLSLSLQMKRIVCSAAFFQPWEIHPEKERIKKLRCKGEFLIIERPIAGPFLKDTLIDHLLLTLLLSLKLYAENKF